VPVFENVDRRMFESEIVPRHRPAVLKGHARDWRATRIAAQGPAALCDYLNGYASPAPVQAWYGTPAMQGRFSYSDDVIGRNFETRSVPLAQLLADILASAADERSRVPLYAGAVNLPRHMPGLIAELPLDLLGPGEECLVSLWVGTRSRTSAHWDLPQNLANVIAGRRRFTLFPIHQIDNLYIGPLDNKLAGQPISLVDFARPDFERFPKFREALAHAEVAELEAGDTLYMPSLCVHHVESLDPFGAMINFWWRSGPTWLGSPLLTLYHAFLTLREMPEDERKSWRVLFDHYVFEARPHDHIPPDARGMLGTLTPEMRRAIKAFVAQSVK